MSKRFLIALLSGLVALQSAMLRADVKLPAIISTNMVLQANKPVPIWGWADPDEKVTVTFQNQSQTAAADADGKWRVTLNPLQPGGPEKMTVAGKNSIEIDNILIGSVWICSGQSNMEFLLNYSHNAKEEIPKADYPKIHLFIVRRATSIEPKTDCIGKWVVCSPATAGGFSAVGYFFGRDIHVASGMPVGLIHTSWGGTVAQAWTSLSGLEKDKELDHFAKDAHARIDGATTQAADKYKEEMAAYQEPLAKWTQEVDVPYQAAKKKYEADVKAAAAAGQPAPPRLRKEAAPPPAPNNPLDAGPNSPTTLFNGMINPLIPYAIEGAIWYQGESNADQWMEYRTLFPRMITDWREKWGEGDFPFYYVQLANFMARHPDPSDSAWAGLREAQFKTLALPNTGMAVIIDIGLGNNIHPTDKMDVGHRLALWAEKDVFKKDVVFSGPLFKEMKIDGNKARLSFNNIGSGLVIGAAPSMKVGEPAATPGDKLTGFAVCGSDKKWLWADAQIDGETVVVSSSDVADPIAVRYAWADNPDCNLYNKEGLPASPFRTDDFPQK